MRTAICIFARAWIVENLFWADVMLTERNNFLDQVYLEGLADKFRQCYSSAQPFPHVVIDDFFPEDVLNEILLEFPTSKEIDWRKFETATEKKLASANERQMGDKTRQLLYSLNSSTFISFLEDLVGIKGIIPDPHFEGGGLHQIERGGYLKVHIDFNRHSRLELDRRLNLLVYLNKDWEEEYGGHLELWDPEMKACAKRILPVFNRLVIFSTNDFSYHGHPEPLTCPEGMTRQSLALYYYSNGRPAEELNEESHSTIFKPRPGEYIGGFRNSFLKQLTPPILVDLVRKAKSKK